MAKIAILLDSNRDIVGKLILYKKDGAQVVTLSALGRADIARAKREGNELALSTKLFGHTPTGIYSSDNKVINSGPQTRYPEKSYGIHGILWLNPVSGVAKIARQNGRTGLAIHGGAFGKSNKLRPTNGCIRLSDKDMQTLINEVKFLFMQDESLEEIEIEERSMPEPLILADVAAKSNDPDPFPYS